MWTGPCGKGCFFFFWDRSRWLLYPVFSCISASHWLSSSYLYTRVDRCSLVILRRLGCGIRGKQLRGLGKWLTLAQSPTTPYVWGNEVSNSGLLWSSSHGLQKSTRPKSLENDCGLIYHVEKHSGLTGRSIFSIIFASCPRPKIARLPLPKFRLLSGVP